MKKKELLKRIENLEFQLDESMYFQSWCIDQIEKLNNQVIDLLKINND